MLLDTHEGGVHEKLVGKGEVIDAVSEAFNSEHPLDLRDRKLLDLFVEEFGYMIVASFPLRSCYLYLVSRRVEHSICNHRDGWKGVVQRLIVLRPLGEDLKQVASLAFGYVGKDKGWSMVCSTL